MKAYFDNFKRYRFLLKELVIKGIKLKYRRSYLGIVWTLLEPLLTMIVLTFVFGNLLSRGDRLYPVYILSGRLLYSFFSGSTKQAMRSIRGNSSMIKKVYVPKYLYPLSTIIYNYVIFLLSLIVLAIVGAVLGLRPTWHLIEVFLPLLVLLIFAFGVGMFVATIAVFFRDLEYLWDVILMLVMYCSGIFYYADDLGKNIVRVIKLNPLYCLISNFRCVLIDGKSIFTATCYGGSQLYMFLYATAFSIVFAVLGTYVFYKNQDKFILHI